ncbi:MAG: chemotaxis protein CheB [Gemmatimonadetes bacterium]|nr:chemotaxis protein CheB [Gemmatimonadota bacterium]
MTHRDIVVVGTSAGGLEVLRKVMRGLPADFPASVLVVQHMAPSGPGLLPRILQDGCALPVSQAQDGESVVPGHVYVARPDHHLTLDEGRVRVTHGPRENHSRPAVDPLFRSAALAFGPRVIGVVLTGRLDDGSAGLWAVSARGGTTVVQDPDDAAYPSMPRSALRYVDIDHVATADELAPLLVRLTGEPFPHTGDLPVPEEMLVETRIAQEDGALRQGVLSLGPLTPYTCPECRGVLVRIREPGIPRFRCHTGHAYSIDSLLAAVTEGIEESLWSSLRAMEEGILLLEHLSEHLETAGEAGATAAMLREKAREMEQRSTTIRRTVIEHETLSVETIDAASPPSGA